MSKIKNESNQVIVIDFQKFFYKLYLKKTLLLIFTSLFVVFGVFYSSNHDPSYRATASFTLPKSDVITKINAFKLDSGYETKESVFSNETKESVFSNFLTNLSSRELQSKVFFDNDFINFFDSSLEAADKQNFVFSIINQINIDFPQINNNLISDQQYSVSLRNSNSKFAEDFLNAIVSAANQATISELEKNIQIKIDIRIDQLKGEIYYLLDKAKKERQNKIAIIKEENDLLKLKIKAQIDNIRLKAKQDRLNEIIILSESAKLANSLGITENNFQLITAVVSPDFTSNIAEAYNLPEWYLYGEKALNKRIELLQNRPSEDPFTESLVKLQTDLAMASSNSELEVLLARKDDAPFIPEMADLESELKKLEQLTVDLGNLNSMEVSQMAKSFKSLGPNKLITVILFGMMGFFLTILVIIFSSFLKENIKLSEAKLKI